MRQTAVPHRLLSPPPILCNDYGELVTSMPRLYSCVFKKKGVIDQSIYELVKSNSIPHQGKFCSVLRLPLVTEQISMAEQI